MLDAVLSRKKLGGTVAEDEIILFETVAYSPMDFGRLFSLDEPGRAKRNAQRTNLVCSEFGIIGFGPVSG